MLRLNLKPKQILEINSKPLLIKLNWVLAFALIIQISLSLYHRTHGNDLRKIVTELKTKAQSLEEQKAKLFEITADSMALAGAVEARNQWLTDRNITPDKILLKLEQYQPQGIKLTSFNATKSGGSLKILTPDTEQVARLFNAIFTQQTGKMTVEDKVQGSILVSYSWTK